MSTGLGQKRLCRSEYEEQSKMLEALVVANRKLESQLREKNEELERMRTTNAQHEAIYRTLTKHLPNGLIHLFDHELRYFYTDGSDLQKLGLDKSAFIGKTIWEALPEEICRQIEPMYRRALASLQSMKEVTYKGYVYQVFTLPVQNDSGQVIAGMVLTQNLTERKQAEREIRQSQLLLKRQLAEIDSIYEAAPMGLAILDAQLRYVRINKWLAKTNGLSLEAHQGKSIRDVVPQIAQNLEPFLHQVLESGRTLENIELNGETCAEPGVQKTWLVSLSVIKDGQGVSGVSVVCEDITERRKAEQALTASEERFRNMADNAPVMVWVTDETGYCNYLSKSWYEFTGQGIEDGKGYGWVDCVHPEDAGMALEVFKDSSEKRVPFWFEYRLRHKSGNYFPFIDAATPWLSAEGEFKGFIGSVIDITEQKNALEELRISEERYRTLFESMEDGFCVIQLIFDEKNNPIDYRFLETNSRFSEHTGLYNVQGKTARELLPGLEEHWFHTYGKVALTGKSARFENGSEVMQRWFEVHAFRIDKPEERKVVLLFKDISERKSLELQKERLFRHEQEAREAAEIANQIKDEFLAVLSHELRTPLNPILGWTRLLQKPDNTPEEVSYGLSTIERNANLQLQLIDDLLDTSRIIRGKLNLSLTEVRLEEPLRAALETVRLASEAKNIRCEVQVESLNCKINGDVGRLQQVMWNILSNAIKFTPSGGCVLVKLYDGDGYAHLEITDSGKGIDPQFLSHLFEFFRQQDASTTRTFGGLGLGLAIARQIVEAHGGEITARSDGEGKGSTFLVSLPLLNPKKA